MLLTELIRNAINGILQNNRRNQSAGDDAETNLPIDFHNYHNIISAEIF